MKIYHKIVGAIFLIGALAFAQTRMDAPTRNSNTVTPSHSSTSGTFVSRVIDGDTFEVTIDGVREKVRMLGIDTPESVDPRKPVECFSHEAADELKKLILDAEITLTPDITNSDRDKYGRLLRYVTVATTTQSINAQMIELGYARAYTRFPFLHRADYLRLQTEARAAGRGLWAPSTCRGRR